MNLSWASHRWILAGFVLAGATQISHEWYWCFAFIMMRNNYIWFHENMRYWLVFLGMPSNIGSMQCLSLSSGPSFLHPSSWITSRLCGWGTRIIRVLSVRGGPPGGVLVSIEIKHFFFFIESDVGLLFNISQYGDTFFVKFDTNLLLPYVDTWYTLQIQEDSD